MAKLTRQEILKSAKEHGKEIGVEVVGVRNDDPELPSITVMAYEVVERTSGGGKGLGTYTDKDVAEQVAEVAREYSIDRFNERYSVKIEDVQRTIFYEDFMKGNK